MKLKREPKREDSDPSLIIKIHQEHETKKLYHHLELSQNRKQQEI